MQAGQLRQRVTIKRPGYSRNDDGERVESLNSVATVWAWARRIKATERVAVSSEGQVNSEADWRVTIRYGADVKDTDAVSYEGRRLDIVSIVDVDESHVWLEIDCKEHRESTP